MFGATNIVKNTGKSKCVYSGHGIAFDGAGSWKFGNDVTRNIVIFCVNNSSSSHTDNCKRNILVLGERPADDINSSISKQKKFSINSSKARTKFCLSLSGKCDAIEYREVFF